MLFFENDYSEGAHPYILRRLLETNMEKLPGYGNDRYTEAAKEKIRCAIGNMDADVFLIAGGTQTNLIVIASVLRPYQCARPRGRGDRVHGAQGAHDPSP